MNSRQRVKDALCHRSADCVPLDLGGTVLSGMHVSSVYKLRQALRLDSPKTPVKVIEPYMMLGEIAPDLMNALGADTIPLGTAKTLFGYRNEGWKPWELFDGTPVLVPAAFSTSKQPNGDVLMYPEGDRSAPPSGRMPKDGYYFDAIVRQPPIDEERLDPRENMEEFVPISSEDLEYYRKEAERLDNETDKAVIGGFCFTGFGDIGIIPAQWLKFPKGIRDIEEWYISLHTRRKYVQAVFERQCEVGLANLMKIHEVVGERVLVTLVTATDFGTQNGSFISVNSYRELFKPFHKKVNDWIHSNTEWKTFMHSCGSIGDLLPDFIDAGFDILNPVQSSASGMNAEILKKKFGDNIVFWGGGVNTQKTLPFGTPKEIREDVREAVKAFRGDGGFVFAAIHNVQANIPVENLIALFESFADYRDSV